MKRNRTLVGLLCVFILAVLAACMSIQLDIKKAALSVIEPERTLEKQPLEDFSSEQIVVELLQQGQEETKEMILQKKRIRTKAILKAAQKANIQTKPIKMIFFGDMMLGRYVRTLMDRYGHDHIFKKIQEGNTFFDGYYDLVIANLEGPIVTNPNFSQTSTIFGFVQDTAEIIKRNGIDMVGLANNHTFDRQEKGLLETKQFLAEAEVEHFGHPIFPEEDDVMMKEIRGTTFAFLGFHDATRRLDDARALKLIQQFDKKVDAVIIYIHWGPEYVFEGTKRQIDLAHQFVDAGADLIIGHHPHVVMNSETYKGVPIYYSLGNFIFDQYFRSETQHGLAVEVVWDAQGGFQGGGGSEAEEYFDDKTEQTGAQLSKNPPHLPKFVQERVFSLPKSVPQWE